MPEAANHSESRLPHRLAVALVCATFPLIWVGGMVTTYEAGMAGPDWPNTYGYNLFLYPWQTWLFGPWDLLVEHGHRLLGALAGIITIAAVIAIWCSDSRRWMKWYSLAVLAAVCAQGALGGMRVLMDERVLARIHACTAPLFFAMAVALAVFTSRRWLSPSARRSEEHASKLHRLSIATAGIAWLQIVMGARLRHVSIELPPREFGDAVFWHLLVAAVLVVHIVLLYMRIRRNYANEPALVRPALGLLVLIACQLALGVATWVMNYGWPAWFQGYRWAEEYVIVQEGMPQAMVTTALVVFGLLFFVVLVMLALRSFRLVRWTAQALAWRPTSLGALA